jgi:hypothetical protein
MEMQFVTAMTSTGSRDNAERMHLLFPVNVKASRLLKFMNLYTNLRLYILFALKLAIFHCTVLHTSHRKGKIIETELHRYAVQIRFKHVS